MAFGRKGARPPGRRLRPIAVALIIAGLGVSFAFAPLRQASTRQAGGAAAPQSLGRNPGGRTSDYAISAHLFLWGKLGEVGTMTIEQSLERDGASQTRILRMAGSSNPEQVKKNRDYRGDFSILRVVPLRPDGSVDEAGVREWRSCRKSATGYLKLNKKVQGEKIEFAPDCAVSTREDGRERRVEGVFDTILAPVEYVIDHDLKVGDKAELPFILNGAPHVFRIEVSDLVTLKPYRSRAYQVDIWTNDKDKPGEKPSKDVWKKKGNVRIWVAKDGPYRNTLLRIKIKFRWYLWLYMDMGQAAAAGDDED